MPDEETQVADPIDELEQLEQGEVAQQPEEPQQEQEPEQPSEEEEQPEWRQHFESPEEMYERFQNVDTLRGRLANELGQTRQQLQQIAAPQQMPQGEMDPDAVPLISQEQLEEMAEDDPFAASAYLLAIQRQQMQQEFEQQLNPLKEYMNQATAGTTVSQLKTEFGDEVVHRNRDLIAERLQNDPDYYKAPQTRLTRLRETIMAAEYERGRQTRQQQAAQQPRQNGQWTSGERTAHVEGGSTPAPSARQTDVDPIIAEMDAVTVREDAFGNPPQFNPPN